MIIIIVISLGGSLIVPDKVDYKFLERFRKIIKKTSKKEKTVIVTGGGSTFRRYMKALEKEKFSDNTYGLIGIATTKLNARVVAGYFNKATRIPNSLSEIRKELKRSNIVICGALGFKTGTTSDGNSAEIAKYFKSRMFVNLTNVNGLYDKDPRKHRNARLIKKISFDDFYKIVMKIKYQAGQHFVLDQLAARIIRRYKIKTVILNGRNIKNLNNFFNGKKFFGTVIE